MDAFPDRVSCRFCGRILPSASDRVDRPAFADRVAPRPKQAIKHSGRHAAGLCRECSSSPRRRARVALGILSELAFWTPFWAVPLTARWIMGEQFSPKDLSVCLFVSVALWLVSGYFGRYQWAYRLILLVPLALGSLLVTGMALSSNGLLTPLTMLAIIDTDRGEATEFISGTFHVRDAAICALLLLPLLVLVAQARWRLAIGPVRYAAAVVAALLALQLGAKYVVQSRSGMTESAGIPPWSELLSYPFDRYPPLQPYIVLSAVASMRSEIAGFSKAAGPVEGVRSVGSVGQARPRTYVVVIGESLARRHMHLYGYGRDTTPALDALAARGELFVFRNVVTSHALTVPALLAALRFPPDQQRPGQTVVDVFNGAGFHTFWISNQYQYGAFESAVSLMTTSVKSRVWLNQPRLVREFNGRYEDRRNFDTAVLPALQEALQHEDKDKLIFVHLMGSHFSYRARYPAPFAYFTHLDQPGCRTRYQLEMIDDYDNSVRFNDAVVSQIIEAVRGVKGDAFVLYFSDHGEEVYDWRNFKDHQDSMLSPYLAEVPFVLWISDGYRSAHPDFTRDLSEVLGHRYVTSDFLYGLTNLARLTFPGMDETRSLFSPDFVARPRITAGRDYDRFAASWAPDAAHAGGVGVLDCAESASMTTR
jgi:glucan phosphoethanolaminetransferase (alkaline phosphatase superfamily)